MKKVILLLAIFSLVIVGCSGTTPNGEEIVQKAMEENVDSDFNWLDAKLVNIHDDQSYTISDFAGKPVLVESFAVWCPTCTKQQRTIKELHELVGDEVVSVSLDTDPNEDAARVLSHVERNGFDWRYSISPKELTVALIDQFGVGVVNAPAAPIVLVCPDQSSKMLPSGTKSVEELQEAIASC
jgi:thiol-disulfide isomerase/thioredoxin